MSMGNVTWNFTQVTDIRKRSIEAKFKKLPREVVQFKYERAKRYIENGDAYSAGELLDSMAAACDVSLDASFSECMEEIRKKIPGLKTKDETLLELFEELYKAYSEHIYAKEYIERIVRNYGDKAFENDTVRVAILKQFLTRLQKGGKSPDENINNFLTHLNKNGITVESLDDTIFAEIENFVVLEKEDCKLIEYIRDKVMPEIKQKLVSEEQKKIYEAAEHILDAYTETGSLSEAEMNVLKNIHTIVRTEGFSEELKAVLKKNRKKLTGMLKKSDVLRSKYISDAMAVVFKDELTGDWSKAADRALGEYFMLFRKKGTEQVAEGVLPSISYVNLRNGQRDVLLELAEAVKENAGKLKIEEAENNIAYLNDAITELKGEFVFIHKDLIDNIQTLAFHLMNDKEFEEKYQEVVDKAYKFVFNAITVTNTQMNVIESVYKIYSRITLTPKMRKAVEQLAAMKSEKSDKKENMSKDTKKLLTIVNDLANASFKMNGRSRNDIYTFAFAFGMKLFDETDVNYDRLLDIEKLMFEVFSDNPFRHLVKPDKKNTDAIPSGEGINYKNFAEVICLYYIMLQDDTLNEYERYKRALKCIKECKEIAKASGFKKVDPGTGTMVFKNTFYGEVPAVPESNLAQYICTKYEVPVPSGFPNAVIQELSIDSIREIAKEVAKTDENQPLYLDDDEAVVADDEAAVADDEAVAVDDEAVTGGDEAVVVDDKAVVAVVKQFIRYACHKGDGKVTGASTFNKKLTKLLDEKGKDENGKQAELTGTILEEYKQKYTANADRALLKLAESLVSGDFMKEANRRESLFKLAIAFGMRMYPDKTVPQYCSVLDVETLLQRYFNSGLDFTKRADVICAYYMSKDELSVNERMQQAFELFYTTTEENPIEHEASEAPGLRDFFFREAIAYTPEEFAGYVLSQYGGYISNAYTSVFNLSIEEITAYEEYNNTSEDIYRHQIKGKLNPEELYEIMSQARSDLRGELEGLNKELKKTAKYNKDKGFMDVLFAMEEMINVDKVIGKKNITRTDIIVLECSRLFLDYAQYVDTRSDLYEEMLSELDDALTRARFQPMSAKNIFDIYIICMMYKKMILKK